jgi:hypothetical protein
LFGVFPDGPGSDTRSAVGTVERVVLRGALVTRHAAFTPDPDPRKDCTGACECCSENARLREENAMLRAAAQAFGDLAERLNIRLQAGRTPTAPSTNHTSRANLTEVTSPLKDRR